MDYFINLRGVKHRDASLALKDISDKQRAKLAEFREQRMSMQNLVDQLDLDLEVERDFTGKVCSEKKGLEIEVKALKEIIAKKEEHDKLQPNKSEHSDDKKFRSESGKLKEVLEIQADLIKAFEKKNEVLNRNLEEHKNEKQRMFIAIEEMEDILKKEVSKTSDEISDMRNKTKDLEAHIKNQKDEIDIKDELISELVSRKENKTNADSS